jgi:hypothetical protein
MIVRLRRLDWFASWLEGICRACVQLSTDSSSTAIPGTSCTHLDPCMHATLQPLCAHYISSPRLPVPAISCCSLLSPTPDLRASSWSNLAASCAAAQPSRRSVVGGLAQQLVALEMSNNAAAAALAEAQALGDMAAGLRPNRLSVDCGGG